MELLLMGNVEIHGDNQVIPLPRAGERCVLASLALDPGGRMHVDKLTERLWDDEPPDGASETITSYVRTVRRAIEDAGGRREWLRNHRPASYQLEIDRELVDYHRFTRLVSAARVRQREGKPTDAVALYEEALSLRRGEALGNVTGQWAEGRRYAMEKHHLDAVCELYQTQLTTGDCAAVATRATDLVMGVIPTDRMIDLTVHALARSGQHAAIPGFVRRAGRRMWDTAGARPSPQVLALARRLTTDPGASPAPPAPGSPPDDGEVTDPVSRPSTSPDHQRSGERGTITLTADHNQHVYQAAGDQYIIGT